MELKALLLFLAVGMFVGVCVGFESWARDL